MVNVDSKGNVILIPRNKDIRALKGIVRSRVKKHPVSVKEMNEAIAEGFSNNENPGHECSGPLPRRR